METLERPEAPTSNDIPEACLEFEWRVYDDATFAGLATLIPIPLVDWLFEEAFRRRIPRGVARFRGRTLSPEVGTELNRTGGCAEACLTLPVKVVWELVKRLVKKILYFLTIKTATDMLSLYWHRAFLIDCMVMQGHVDDAASAKLAREAMERTLAGTSTSPMLGLARGVVGSTQHAYRLIRKAQRGEEDEEIREKRSILQRGWDDIRDYLIGLATRYNAHYAAVEAEMAASRQEAETPRGEAETKQDVGSQQARQIEAPGSLPDEPNTVT